MTTFKKGDRVITCTEAVHQKSQMSLDGLVGTVVHADLEGQVAEVVLDLIRGVLPFAFQELSDLKPKLYALVHEHCEGITSYVFKTNKIKDEPSERDVKMIVKLLKINYEPDEEEGITISLIDEPIPIV